MAFDLRAIISLTDKFSDPLRKIERQVQRNQSAMDKLNKTTSTADRNHINLAGNLGRVTSGFGSLKSSIIGVAAAYVTLQSAKSIFEATVGNAAKFEQSNVVIGAMFNDKELAKQYTAMLDRFAADSPVMDSQAMYANSKGFITTSKDIGQLEKMWSLAERMAAIDPQQGVEGAVFALRELFSGDAVSMVERFEMPRQIMNEIKKLPLDQQLTKLDEYFNKIGMTTHLIDEMGGTTLGLWAQVREKFQLVLRDMGQPSLEVISNFLNNVLSKLDSGELDRFAQVGARWIQHILTGLSNGIINVYEWFNSVTSSPEWKEASTLSAKVDFLIENLLEKFNKWYEESGKSMLETSTNTVMGAIADAIENNSDKLAGAALSVGSKIGSSLVSGVSSALENNPLVKALLGAAVGGGIGSIVPGVGTLLGAGVGAAASLAKHYGGKLADELTGGKSHNGGLNYVPYDGYRATLHKGEQVLTRSEARDYRDGKSRGGNTYQFGNIIIQGGPTDRVTAQRLLEVIADEIQAAGGAGA